MMHPIPGGAAARPFVPHHHALDMHSFCASPGALPQAPGGWRIRAVYEVNRNFRISLNNNPGRNNYSLSPILYWRGGRTEKTGLVRI